MIGELGERITTLVRDNMLEIPDFPEPNVLFRDITELLANGPAFKGLVELIGAHYASRIDTIASLELRGSTLGVPMVAEFGFGMLVIHKAGKLSGHVIGIDYKLEYGTARMEMHPESVHGGQHVFIIDGVLATGGIANAAVKLLRQCGVSIETVVVLLEFDAPGGCSALMGVTVESALHLQASFRDNERVWGSLRSPDPLVRRYHGAMNSDDMVSGSALPAAGSRVCSGLAWFGSCGHATIPEIEPPVRTLWANHPKADISVAERAYCTAKEYHHGQMCKSGKPYITHPVAAATILAEIGMTIPTLVAALLYDTVEDTDYTLGQLAAEYDEAIANPADGVIKPDKVYYGVAAQFETLRETLVAMSRDIRVLFIKLGDRLHNAHTWRFVPAKSVAEKVKGTLEIYASLVHRLGMDMVKWELRELSFKMLYSDIYEKIDRLVMERASQREEYLRDVIDQVEEDLRRSGTKGVVSGRLKSHYSIYQKMVVRGRAFGEVYDLVAVCVLVELIKDCHGVLGALHGCRSPIPDRFKDYIVMSKSNLYQSLHTTVIGPGGKPVEIQIRTFDMHEYAEHGVAVHWKYKQNPNASSGDADRMSSDEQANWLCALVEMERETGDPEEFLDSLHFKTAGDGVYVFTSRGQVIVLPVRLTPVDLAYAVYTEVGHRTVGAKVNGRLAFLDTRLESGETVEVVTPKPDKSRPPRGWLAFVASPRARSEIKAWFFKGRRERAVEAGEEVLTRAMREQNPPFQCLVSHKSILLVATSFGYSDVSSLYVAVGEGHISAQDVASRLVDNLGGGDGTEETLSEAVTPGSQKPRSEASGGAMIIVAGPNPNEVWVKLVKCYTSVPGDDIVGFITRGQGISVHRSTCANTVRLGQLQPERFVNVSWNEKGLGASLRVQIEMRALDRGGLLLDLTRVLFDYRVNIPVAALKINGDQVASGNFSFELADFGHLSVVLPTPRRVDGAPKAVRLGTDSQTRRGRPVSIRAKRVLHPFPSG